MDTQLIAALIGGKNAAQKATRLVADLPTYVALQEASEAYLVKRVGREAAKRIKAATHLKPDDTPPTKITGTRDAYNLFRSQMENLEQEELWVAGMDIRMKVLFCVMVFRGTRNTCPIGQDMWRKAVREGATNIIFAHNHPSGDPSPSPEDISATRKMVEAGELLGIKVQDHLVIGKNAFCSMRERGHM